MSTTTTWVLVTLAGLATLAIRLVPIALVSTRPVPAWLDRIGPLTAPVAFAALGASAVTGASAGGPSELLPLLGAVTVAAVVARRTGSTGWAVGSGMAALWAGAALVALG